MSASVSLDWLAFTVKVSDGDFNSVFSALTDFTGEKIISRGRGARGYSDSSDLLDGGFVAWSLDIPQNGVHIVLNSSSLAMLKRYSVLDIFQFFYKLGGKCTRLDFAFDDFSGLLDLENIADLLSRGCVVSRWKSFRVLKGSSAIGASLFSGFTVYVGSRQSESFLRFYDKKQERLDKGFEVSEDTWVRCEIEMKGHKAVKVFDDCSLFSDEDDFVIYISGLLFGLIDFKSTEFFNFDCIVTRLSSASFWLDFLGNVSKCSLSLPKKERSLEILKNWFDVSVSPSLAVVNELPGGGDWIAETLERGRERWKKKHIDLYADAFDKGLDIRLSELGLK